MKKPITGINTEYQLYQHPDVQAPVLLLLHGWGGSWQSWAGLIPQLTQWATVLSLDLPAFGKSDSPASVWSSKEFAEWVDACIDSLLPQQKVIVIGHSFGGKIACYLAVDHPDKVEQLVLIAAAGIPVQLSISKKMLKNMISLVPSSVKKSLRSSSTPQLLRRLGVSDDYATSTAAQRQIFLKVVYEDLSYLLPSISQQTLLIWGKDDVDTPLWTGEKFAELIPHARLEEFDQAGHFVFVDQPQQVLESIANFVQSSEDSDHD